jgi:phenylalanyl-tRNA synthetase beta chain
MRVSLDWLADYVTLPGGATPADVARALTLKTVEVEDVVDLGVALARVVVGEIVSVDPRSRTVVCDVGNQTVTATSTLDESRVGSLAAVGLVGATLTVRGERRSVERISGDGRSVDAVVCTAANLGLDQLFPGDTGVLDLTALDVEPGTTVAEAVGYDDVVFEIDNKSLTNRPDLWGHYGIARELAAIYRVALSPLPKADRPAPVTDLVGDLDEEVCSRFTAVAYSVAVEGLEAPLWIRSRLARIGEASRGLHVDLSNYVMFAVGQPTHVYDADRIRLPLSVTSCRTAETVDLVAGGSVHVAAATPLVRDENQAVAVAGVMGSAGSAVRETSRRFVLEAATFAPGPVRRTSQALGVRTEASARYEKGLDTQRVDQAVGLFLDLLQRCAPGAQLSGMQDQVVHPTVPAPVEVELTFLRRRIGTKVAVTDIRRILEDLGFVVTVSRSRLDLLAPTWRSTGDVSLPHDIVEEVARLLGYDSLPTAALTVPLKPVRSLNQRPIERVIRERLAAVGLREVLTYPWVSDALLAATGYPKVDTVRLQGAPAPDRDSLRPSLVPNLIEAAATNRHHTDRVAIFEVGTVFAAGPVEAYAGRFEPMPAQSSKAAAVLSGSDGRAVFLVLKGILESVARHAHLVDVGFTAGETDDWADRSACAVVTTAGRPVGTLGLLSTRVRRLCGIDNLHVACFELDLAGLAVAPSRTNTFEALSDLPEAEFDLSIVVADVVAWGEVERAAREAASLVHRVTFVDEFRGSWVPADHRSLSLRVTLRPEHTTLTAGAIGEVRTNVLAALQSAVGASLRA